MLTVLDAADLPRLREAWNELADRCPGHYLSQTWRWATAAWKTVAAPSGHELRIVTLREGDRLVAVWPLVLYRSEGLRIVRPLGSESSEYTAPLSEPGPQGAERLVRLWRAVASLGDLLFLAHVRSDDPLAGLLKQHRLQCFEDNLLSAPWIARADHDGWAAYLKTISRSHRANLRRRHRQLSDKGALVFEQQSSPVDQTVIDGLLAQKAEWIAQRGLSNPWLGRAQYRSFLAALTTDADDRDGLTLFSLTLDGTPIAFQLSAVDGRRVEFMIGAFDRQWARYSPGQLLVQACVQWAFERGLDYDFRIGGEEYKSDWTQRDTLTFDCRVGLSARGLATVWLLHVRRSLQRLRFRIGAGRLLGVFRRMLRRA